MPLDEGRSDLAQRLRELRWPEVTPEVRQRCWERLRQQVATLNGQDRTLHGVEPDSRAAERRPGSDRGGGSGGLQERRFGHHEFASRLGHGAYKGALGQRIAMARRAAAPRVR